MSAKSPHLATASDFTSGGNFLRSAIDHDLNRRADQQRYWDGVPGSAVATSAAHDPARVRTRFPPEPNGYLHVGHAKAIYLNYGVARDYQGAFHLRFDDTNPEKEEQEYVDGIIDIVKWLGCDWSASPAEREHGFIEPHKYFASDYFEQLYLFAEYLIELGYAYVDSQDADAIRANRGTLTEGGRNSPHRDRTVEENLALFRAMREGKYPDGAHVLRARLDMASPNINMRDPVLYRIRHAHHHRTGDTWCIYPLYDYTHCISDALENITHSLCSLEFEDHRPLYDWVLERIAPVLRPAQFAAALDLVKRLGSDEGGAGLEFALKVRDAIDKLQSSECEMSLRKLIAPWSREAPPDNAAISELTERLLATPAWFAPLLSHALDGFRPNPFGLSHQYEFARLNLTYVITSKRRIRQLVTDKHVDGWDDPRLPTLYGFRRRGYTPESLQLFCERLGVSRSDSWIDYAILEQTLREDLDPKAPRITAVLDPLPLIIDNYDAKELLWCEAPVHPHHEERGRRRFPFTRELAIEREDFMETPTKGYFRLYPGNRVRLRHAFVVECTGCDKDASGQVIAVHANILPDTRSGTPGADSIKVKGNIHWVSHAHAKRCEVRLYDRLFTEPEPDAGGRDFLAAINPKSKTVVTALLEPGADLLAAGERVQFERHGYFIADVIDSAPGQPVFNRITTLKDSWIAKGTNA
jgi:glutaminyl-tRNA synthetase